MQYAIFFDKIWIHVFENKYEQHKIAVEKYGTELSVQNHQ